MSDRDEQDSTGGVPGVREVAPDVYSIWSDPEPRGSVGRAWMWLRGTALGKPLPSRLERAERIGILSALGLIGADMIASSVYGPEEMMRMLGEAGPGAVSLAFPIGISIIILLTILAVSYQQTISAYPNGAGGYIVASDNLGARIGLIAAAALLVDYSLDVAVSIASGVQSLTSALPELAGARVLINVVVLLVLTVANLRGVRAAGALFSAPVHLFILGTLGVIAYGLYRWSTNTLPAYTPPESAAAVLSGPTEAVGLFLLLRAFSAAAVALTGIEAISNGVPYFKPPETRNARLTLVIMAVAFGVLFLGVAFLAAKLGVVADPDEVETVLSQITRTLLGTGPLYIVLQGFAILMLILAADTGFADFPRLLALLAKDAYVPSAFSARGTRLSFSNGIVLVALVSAVLIVAFGGSVGGLVPLFTVGAFLTFTLSQAGMVRHWWRKRTQGWHWRMAVNGLGAVTTALVLIVVLVSKFLYGAWIVALVVPVLVLALGAVGRHNQRMRKHLEIASDQVSAFLAQDRAAFRHRLIVPVAGADRLALHALAYAESLTGRGDNVSHDHQVVAVHVTDDRAAGVALQQSWTQSGISEALVILESPYRETAEALMRYIDVLQQQSGRGTVVTVVLPETLPSRWWHPLLRNYLGWRLKWALLFRPGCSVLSVPYEVED
ncbi:MAG: APC family permease [Chloroflexota bacterium]